MNYDGQLYATQVWAYAPSTGNSIAIFGYTPDYDGVRGQSGTATGTSGVSTSGRGIYGVSTSGYGVYGQSNSGYAGYFIHPATTTVPTSSTLSINRQTTGSSAIANNLLEIIDNPTTSGTISGSILKATIVSTVRMDMNPRVVATGGDAYIFDTHNVLTTSNLLSLKNQAVVKNYITSSGKQLFTAGVSSTFVIAPGILKDFYVDAANVGTGETDLYSYTTLANILATNGDKITAKFCGTATNNSNTKVVRFYFAGTNVDANLISLGAGSNDVWEINIAIIRVSSTVARLTLDSTVQSNGILWNDYLEYTSKDWTATNVLKITGQGGASNDIIAKMGFIEYKPSSIN